MEGCQKEREWETDAAKSRYETRNKSMFCKFVVAVRQMNGRRKRECIKMPANKSPL